MQTFTKTSLMVGLMLALGACSVARDNVRKDVRETQKFTESTPTRNITNFASALRCMDTALIDYGKRDQKIIIEDLEDRTGDIRAGTKDMLITAVSDMTKRSRAISLVAYGNDSGNLVAFLNAAGQQGAFKDVPEFDIRGSISQHDKDVISKGADTGGSADVPGGVLGGGFGGSAKGSVLGLDLSIVRTSDLTLVPGVVSRNSIVIVTSGFGGDIDATIKKAGVNFSFSVSRAEGRSQALRNLVELAAIELVGRLNKIPYWSCLGVDPETAEVKEEISDWYYTLDANNEMVSYVQSQLRLRNYYNGPINNQMNTALQRAITAYKRDVNMKKPEVYSKLGLTDDATLNEPFYTALLNVPLKSPKPPALASSADTNASGSSALDPTQAVASLSDTVGSPSSPQTKPSAAAGGGRANESRIDVKIEKPSNVHVSDAAQNKSNNVGSFVTQNAQRLNFVVKSPDDAYLYCYYRDDDNKIMRIYPNRFKADSFVSANEEIQIPGSMPFQIASSAKGVVEQLACYTTQRDVLNDLPAALKVTDFVGLKLGTMSEVRKSIETVADSSVREFSFDIKVQ